MTMSETMAKFIAFLYKIQITLWQLSGQIVDGSNRIKRINAQTPIAFIETKPTIYECALKCQNLVLPNSISAQVSAGLSVKIC